MAAVIAPAADTPEATVAYRPGDTVRVIVTFKEPISLKNAMLHRTHLIISPDVESLEKRWHALINAPAEKKEALFHPHLTNGKPGDRHTNRILQDGLPGYSVATKSVADETSGSISPVRYGFRSFDRQWIIPDNRVINRPNPELWAIRSEGQVYLTALSRSSPFSGPAVTFTGFVPDHDHYKGSFSGRVFPLWRDAKTTIPNVSPELLAYLAKRYGESVIAEDFMAYIAAVAAHPAFTSRFQDDLSTPGLRIPLTEGCVADARLLVKMSGCSPIASRCFVRHFRRPTPKPTGRKHAHASAHSS